MIDTQAEKIALHPLPIRAIASERRGTVSAEGATGKLCVDLSLTHPLARSLSRSHSLWQQKTNPNHWNSTQKKKKKTEGPGYLLTIRLNTYELLIMASSTWSFENIYAQLTPLNTCKTLSIILALHMIHVGLWVLWDTPGVIKAFGLRYDEKPFATSQTTSDSLKKKAQSASSVSASTSKINDGGDGGNFWPLLFAPREVGFGVLLLVFAGLGEWRAVGVTTAVTAGLLATADGVATVLYGKDGWPAAVKEHWVPAVVLGVVAGGLLAL